MSIRFAPLPNGKYLVTRECLFARGERSMELGLRSEDLDKYLSGTLVQVAFPYLSADEREFLVSGLLPGEWEQITGA